MESLNQNNFEEEWQRAFENASISPPSDMWDKIELELDRKKRRPFLFFLRPAGIATGMAAALLLVMGGILIFNKNYQENTKDFSQNSTKTKQSTKPQIAQTEKSIIDKKSSETHSDLNNEQLASTKNIAENVEKLITKNKKTYKEKTSRNNEFSKTQNSNDVFEKTIAKAEFKEENNISENKNVIAQNIDNQIVTDKNETVLANIVQNGIVEINALNSKKFVYYGSRYTLNRNKLAFDVEAPEIEKPNTDDSKFWLGFQSGVSPFDPNMKLGGLNTVAMQQADAFASAVNDVKGSSSAVSSPATAGNTTGKVAVSQPQNGIKSGVGTNLGFAFGYKIAKKWNLESGIRYLRGNSTLQSNTYAFQQNGYVNTFLADYLLQNSAKSNYVLNGVQAPINTVVADASQFNNRYEYLMIPMQIGYEIGLSEKLGLNLLAGVSADVFLKNTIANDNTFVQEKNTINGSSKIYNPLNISALGGLRASYLLSKHWQANLGSSYQYSLFSGINASTNLQMRLRMFGVNYGVSYRF